MCGISGIVRRSAPGDLSSMIRKVNDTMAHRGPDADAFFVEEEIAFGHRRLSIIDLSTAANQPFVDHSGRYVMVFNGEIYNYEEIKKKITDYPFRTTSDTEVLLAAYIKWGADCLDHLRGMFAFVVWDRQEKELFMARDRMGVKPLYYYHEGDTLVFASEVRAVLACGLMKRQLEQAALADYFSYQSVSYPYSLIKGIVQLEAASWMRWKKNGNFEKHRYWEVTGKSTGFDFADQAAVRTKIKELMLQSVGRRLVSDVPVGAFLSGGIDSSLVVGLMAEAGNAAPNTFNISFEEEQYDESRYAEIIAKKFNTNHTKILLKPTVFLDELQNALGAMDTPSGDGVNTYVVSKAIRDSGMKVAVSGVGGDELFAGYPFFAQYEKIRSRDWLWKLPAGLRKSLAAVLQGSGGGTMARMAQLLRNDSPGIVDAYPVFRQILSPSMLKGLTTLPTGPAFPTSLKKDLYARRGQLDSLPLLSQVSAADYIGYTQHTLLKDTDQMSMAVSLEVREPFFDQDLLEFVMNIPDDIKRPTYPKSLLVESLKPLLPDEVVFRKKKGFTFPWNVWLRNELRSFCEERIDNISQRSFIHGDNLKDLWKRFLAGDKNVRWMEIWLFIVLEYWLEKNDIDG